MEYFTPKMIICILINVQLEFMKQTLFSGMPPQWTKNPKQEKIPDQFKPKRAAFNYSKTESKYLFANFHTICAV